MYETCDSLLSKGAFFQFPSLKIVANRELELRGLKMASRGVFGASLGALERLLARSWALLARSWALLGCSWGALGALLGALGALLGALGTLLRRLGTLLGRSGDALGALWGVLGASRAILARFLTLPEWILSPLDIDFWVSASCSAKRLGVDFASALRLTCERLASDSQVRRPHCVGRHSSESTRVVGRLTDTRCEAKARRVYQSRRHADRHMLRSKNSTT